VDKLSEITNFIFEIVMRFYEFNFDQGNSLDGQRIMNSTQTQICFVISVIVVHAHLPSFLRYDIFHFSKLKVVSIWLFC